MEGKQEEEVRIRQKYNKNVVRKEEMDERRKERKGE